VKQKIIVRDEPLRNRAVAVCATIPLNEPHEVVIRPHKVDKTDQQRRYYFRIVGIMAGELGYEKEELHTLLKKDNLLPIFLAADDMEDFIILYFNAVRGNCLESFLRENLSINRAKIHHMREYIDCILRQATNLGIRLPVEER
jgi:hypothetical protein